MCYADTGANTDSCVLMFRTVFHAGNVETSMCEEDTCTDTDSRCFETVF